MPGVDPCRRRDRERRRLLRAIGQLPAPLDPGAQRPRRRRPARPASYLERTTALFEDVVDRIRRNESGWLDAVATKGQYLATEADALREANLQRLAAQRIAPTAGIFFNDMLVAMRRIRNHALNLAEAMLGKK